MSTAQYTALPTSEHPQVTSQPTRDSTAWFWNAREERSVQVDVISIDSEPEEAPRMPPTPQDAVFSNIVPARTSEAEELAQALVAMGFISADQAQPPTQSPDTPPYYQPAPSYETVEDPITLASYLFKYGFVFPLFWLVGAFIIISDLHHESSSASYLESQPPSPTTPKDTYELQLKREEMALLRLAELKWAWRCAYAFAIWFALVLFALGALIGTGCVQLF
ncbi:putative transmembrane protein [Rhizoctonia solani 123E]|uniref:Putative transmembrane protein n=1 Tax=Rhizoctonia solani 123E TaxID=1423351 RepID=A0A074RXI7_9AGAM|nr:putative transmembrane protein [Rhizoctonia solani 123E]